MRFFRSRLEKLERRAPAPLSPQRITEDFTVRRLLELGNTRLISAAQALCLAEMERPNLADDIDALAAAAGVPLQDALDLRQFMRQQERILRARLERQ